jgi:hypothetical protein
MAKKSDFEEGKRAGRVAQTLKEHADHLNAINGSIARSAKASEDLASEIRLLREESRLRDERVTVAAETLATETERRRSALADVENRRDREIDSSDRQFTRRQVIFGAVIGAAGLALAILAASGNIFQ